MQYNSRFFTGWTGASMIEPKRVLRALAEHWTLLEPPCERFDAGTLSLVELRHQLAAQLPEVPPTDITALIAQWIRLDILVPVATSPHRFELNPQIHDFPAYLRREHRPGQRLPPQHYPPTPARTASRPPPAS